MKPDKTNPKYLAHPQLHLKKLNEFKSKLEMKVLGEADGEWRDELQFVLDRTKDKIRKIQKKVL